MYPQHTKTNEPSFAADVCETWIFSENLLEDSDVRVHLPQYHNLIDHAYKTTFADFSFGSITGRQWPGIICNFELGLSQQ